MSRQIGKYLAGLSRQIGNYLAGPLNHPIYILVCSFAPPGPRHQATSEDVTIILDNYLRQPTQTLFFTILEKGYMNNMNKTVAK